jgi:hypothetical protein
VAGALISMLLSNLIAVALLLYVVSSTILYIIIQSTVSYTNHHNPPSPGGVKKRESNINTSRENKATDMGGKIVYWSPDISHYVA